MKSKKKNCYFLGNGSCSGCASICESSLSIQIADGQTT